ncbi:MAG: bacillithiol system redox-active protein YtxJ [Salibacteraceae bacterium]
MGFWNSLTSGPSIPEHWNELESIDQLTEVFALSTHKPVVIFKHSTRCGISMSAKRRLEKGIAPDAPYDFYYLDLLRHRDVSDAIAEKTKLTHQSPQLIVLVDGQVRAHGSHEMVNAQLITGNLSQ